MSVSNSEAFSLSPTWMQVVERITATLEQAISRASEREQSVQPTAASAAADVDHEAAINLILSRLEERWHDLEASLRKAERQAADAGEYLESTTAGFKQWTQVSGVTRNRLAEWGGQVPVINGDPGGSPSH